MAHATDHNKLIFPRKACDLDQTATSGAASLMWEDDQTRNVNKINKMKVYKYVELVKIEMNKSKL